tara:strand:+ start:12816 stop:13463 length:648 start_codon:yes stop_codon:yes gene_type:complete
MSVFVYDFSNGSRVEVDLPNIKKGICQQEFPSENWNAGALMLQAQSNASNLQEKENYLIEVQDQINVLSVYAENIYLGYKKMVSDCNNGVGLNFFEKALNLCSTKSRYCDRKNNKNRSARDKWETINDDYLKLNQSALQELQGVRDDIGINTQQAVSQAQLDQLLAQTQQKITLAEYDRQARENELQKEKTDFIFLPIIIALVLVFLFVYLFRKN